MKKSYQENDSVISTVTTKVKGFAFTNPSDAEARVWDVADYVIPPQVRVFVFAEGPTKGFSWRHLRIWCFHRAPILSLC